MSLSKRAVLRPAEHTQMLNRRLLHLGIRTVARHSLDDFPRLGRAALRQHEQRLLLQAVRGVALEHLFQQRHGALGVGVHQAVDGDELEVLVGLLLGLHRQTRAAPRPQLERLGLLDPAAVGKRARQLLQRFERFALQPLFVLRIRFPIKRCVGARAALRGGLAEFCGRLGPLLLAQQLAALVIELLGAVLRKNQPAQRHHQGENRDRNTIAFHNRPQKTSLSERA